MDKKGLIIGIDFTEEFCMVCYFNEKHGRVENAADPLSPSVLLIPSVVCYDAQRRMWLIGENAKTYAHSTGAFLYTQLLTNTIAEGSGAAAQGALSYGSIFAVFMDALIENALKCSGYRSAGVINITMRRVSKQIRDVLEGVFARTRARKERVHLLSYQECFAYFIAVRAENERRGGADLFDFSAEGFFLNRLTYAGGREKNIIFINERNLSMDFSYKDLRNVYMKPQLDERLCSLYEELKKNAPEGSVYFTGEGFEELWYSNTLSTISREKRVFRGNNIYARGAAWAGVLRSQGQLEDFMVICRSKTRAAVSVWARSQGEPSEIILSAAALNWYEASGWADFIPDETKKISFIITSPLSRQKAQVEFDLSSFPDRPPLASRVRVSAEYINEFECEISVRDLGFGEFFAPSGLEVKKILNLEGYI